MKLCLVSTYPQQGSQNIGDALITNATMNYLRDKLDECSLDFCSLWRASSWDSVKSEVLASDFIVFPCLAIRRDMAEIQYPFIERIMESEKPFFILAAGTSLPVDGADINFSNVVSERTASILRRIDDQALFFSSRGALTQSFLSSLGLKNARLTGDIAFYDPRFLGRRFGPVTCVRRIAVSDPHYGTRYATVTRTLLAALSAIFPDADIDILQHGNDKSVTAGLVDEGFTVREIFRDKDSGLDAYDDYDLHVGFRVHGHVSSLNRRIPSYLLEQDGRGADYGLTLDANISIPCYPREANLSRLARLERRLRGGSNGAFGTDAITALVAMLRKDRDEQFRKFLGLEEQLIGFTRAFAPVAELIEDHSKSGEARRGASE
ncbi:polysaccharide pyruvyl transferase family protein [Alcanivorax sp. MM125-6]|nr:polysaccharide pyruvyl transferase family protein [Alcanivorax sp. MM125-6]